MGYALGIDLGTAFTAAATFRDGHAEIATLGTRTAAVPSVVLVRDAEEMLTGEAAERRAASEPDRVAREFKRRLGDTTPIFLAGSPYSAEALMARMLQWVVDEVSKREGGPPDRVTICHPANWGAYKRELLENAIRQANLDGAIMLTEPEAAAIDYAATERVEAGDAVAIYDLGGGTFDSAVLRKTADGWETLGTPEGIERLGGIDFDAAVFAHVQRSLGGALDALDEEDATAMAAVGRLRQECVDAKQALSEDTEASIPVLLPNFQTQIRLTRREFEDMIRPQITSTIQALQRALKSAGVTAEQVKAVLLVGGSSRIPLVAQMITAELGRPVNIDAHPKHSIALGAARAAARDEEPASGAAGPGAGAAAAAVGAAGVGAVVTGADSADAATGAGGATAQQSVGTPGSGERFRSGGGGGGAPPDRREGDRHRGGRNKRALLIALAAIVVGVLVGGGLVLASSKSDDTKPTEKPPTPTTSSTTTTTPVTTTPVTTPRTTPRTNPTTTTTSTTSTTTTTTPTTTTT